MPIRLRLASHAPRTRSGARPFPGGSATGLPTFLATTTSSGCEASHGASVRSDSAVHVRAVEEVAAGLEVAVQHPVRLVARCLAAHEHRAEAEPGHLERAKVPGVHRGCRLLRC